MRIFNKEPKIDQFTEAWQWKTEATLSASTIFYRSLLSKYRADTLHGIKCNIHRLGFRNQRSSYWVNKCDQILRISKDLVQSVYIWWFYQLCIWVLADFCKFSELEAWNLHMPCMFQAICTLTTNWSLDNKVTHGGWSNCQTCCDRVEKKARKTSS